MDYPILGIVHSFHSILFKHCDAQRSTFDQVVYRY